MTGFKGDLALTWDLFRFLSVISDVHLGGNRYHFGGDISGGISFRYRAKSAGVRAEWLLGLKTYHYNAEVLSYSWSASYSYSNADQIEVLTPKVLLPIPIYNWVFWQTVIWGFQSVFLQEVLFV